MSKIKCPNCNIDIDSNLTSCPFCGGQLTSNNATNNVDPKWVNIWARKIFFARIISALIFILLDVLSMVIIRLDDSTTNVYISTGIFILSIIPLIVFVFAMFKFRGDVEDFDGYKVLIIQTFYAYLVIEGKVVAKKFLGLLPIKQENMLDPSTVCLFLNIDNPEVDAVSAENLKNSKDLLGRLPNNKKVLAHFVGKNYELMKQVDNK